MKLFLSIVLILIFTACKSSEARTPTQQNSGNLMEISIQKNKDLNSKEYAKIKTFIYNSNGLFKASSYGFWFRYDLENTQSKYKPEFGDQVFYQYAVKNLNGNYIYSPNETEEKSYCMEQQDLLPGLREGLKLMKRGEKMTFIFPSQLAYGFYGDNDKIGPDTPLIYEVSILKIIQN